MPRLSDLFTVKKGHGLDLTNIEQSAWGTGIAYVSCSDNRNGVTGWVRPIAGKTPAGPGTISVALTGNSVLAAFIQENPYYMASHMAMLTPIKSDMTFAEKLWWAQCIRANRYRFGFGRKADRTISDLIVPDAVPAWVTDETARAAIHEFARALPRVPVQEIPRRKSQTRTIVDLFDVKRGHGLDLVHLAQVAKGTGLAYVSRTENHNGVLGWVKPVEEIEPAKAGTISVSLGGSVLAAFVQPVPYYTAQNVDVLTPLNPMTLSEKLWWTCCIRANRYRYNYGRHANRTFKTLVIPSAVPEWVGVVPHDAVDELTVSVDEVADSIDTCERPVGMDDRLKVDVDPEDALRALLRTSRRRHEERHEDDR